MKLTQVKAKKISSTNELRSKAELTGTSKDLIGFIYDIPKDEQIDNKKLTEIFQREGLICKAQIVRDESKRFYSARVKFETIIHLQVAT